MSGKTRHVDALPNRTGLKAWMVSWTGNSLMSGGPCGATPAAAIPSPIRGWKASKSSRDSQKSITPQPPSIGPDEWKEPFWSGARRIDVVVRSIELLLSDPRELDADPNGHDRLSFAGGRQTLTSSASRSPASWAHEPSLADTANGRQPSPGRACGKCHMSATSSSRVLVAVESVELRLGRVGCLVDSGRRRSRRGGR